MKGKSFWALATVVCLVLFLGETATLSMAMAADSPESVVPRLIQFSGVVKDATGKVVVGSATLTFSLYQFPEGGTPLWAETQTVTTDDQGHYTVLLGAASVTGLPLDLFTSGAARWLGVQPQLPGVGESPRVLLVGVPYALKAADAETLGGKPASAFVTTDSVAPPSRRQVCPPDCRQDAGATSPKDEKNSKATNSTTITGGGTTNFVPLWTGSSTLGNSTLFQSGANIGLGTTTPTQLLQVSGAGGILSSGSGAALYFQMRDGSTQSAWYGFGNVSRFWRSDQNGGKGGDIIAVNSAGQVGIGTDSPTQLLHVNGTGGMLSSGSGAALYFQMRDSSVQSAWYGTGNVSRFWRSDKGDIIGVTSAGNVGIGTTAPVATLDVVGTSSVPVVAGTNNGSGNGVSGNGTSGQGVSGHSTSGDGVDGESTDGFGVLGQSKGNGDGVEGTVSGSGLAGNFQGNLSVSGAIFAGTKDFRIDHPLDPENRYLYHASVESSEMKNIYDGMATLDANGQALVELPTWFESLNRDFRYQLTAVGAPAPGLYIAEEVQNNQFKIAGGSPGAKVSWQVTGVRQDAYARVHPLAVEVEKTSTERGYYIHPELYGAPEEKGIEWARHPELMKRMKEMREKQATLTAEKQTK